MQRIFNIFILGIITCNLYSQKVDSVKVPRYVISEVSRYQCQVLVDVPMSLTTLRTAGTNALGVQSASGFGEREILVMLQTSPYDEQYFSKGLLVGRNFIAEIRTNWAGEQVIVFKRKK